jgi:hypothetical protein
MVAMCATGVNQAPSYEKDLVDDRDAGGSRWRIEGGRLVTESFQDLSLFGHPCWAGIEKDV